MDARTRQVTQAIRESSAAPQQSNTDATTRAREELTRFLGIWRMEGWMQEPGSQRVNVTAQVNGDIEMTYFVELAYIDLKATGIDTQLWGSSMLAYDAGDGYSISTRLNVMPEPLRAENGRFDQSSRSFTFSGADYRVVIRFETPDRFSLETTSNGQTVESYSFTRT